MNSFEAQILTPEGTLFDGEVVGVQLPGTMGSFEVKSLHADIISTLEIGRILVRKADGKDLVYAVSGGFVEVHDNTLTLLAEAAEPVSSIDVERAEAARERARERLALAPDDKSKSIDRERAKKALARAENRIQLSADISVSTR